MSDTQKIDFRKTLNLPQTDFSMRAGLVKKEPAMLEKWNKEDLQSQIKAKSEGKKTFILHDGPPYANGNIHIGHALNKILKDIIIKSKTMQGFDVPYVPGWDCHGLPIEHQLMKEMKVKSKADVDPIDFRQKAHDYALKYVGLQAEQFKRLGIFGEWDQPYLTVNKDYEYWILKSLENLQKKGYIYRGLKPVNWCVYHETALAEAEIEYEDITTKTVYVKFSVENSEKLIETDKPVSLLIWTTTPWTLVANVAVSVHEKLDYVFLDIGDEVLIVEKTLSESVLSRANIEKFEFLKIVSGKELTELTYKHIFGTRTNCPVVTADYVTTESGTGLVHTAPGHGQDDFDTGKKYNLDVVMPVNDKGVYIEGPYEGQFVFKANKQIIDDLEESKDLFATEDIVHSYPHSWRSKKPIIFRATHQWFLKVDHDGLREKLEDVIKNDVEWIPGHGQERILGMIQGRPDWCLSRQRHWGVPIPALKPKAKDNQPRLYPQVIEAYAEFAKTEGSAAWYTRDVKDFLPKDFKCPETGAMDFEKTFDILDVWFDSGVSHKAVVESMMKQELPADLYLEGSDQHRGWFQSSLIPCFALEGHAPYKQVLTHGFVVDGQGRKMSKSLGNVVKPEEIISQSGADILRLWVASSSYNEDIRLSKEILNQIVDGYRKIRNTFRYLLSNLYDFDPQKDALPYSDLLETDKYVLHRLQTVIKDVQESYNSYSFSKVYKTIYAFCNEDLSNFYLDILKDRLYVPAANDPERRSAQTVLNFILEQLVLVLAPILVFTCEEVIQTRNENSQNIHLQEWKNIPSEWYNSEVEKNFEKFFDIRPLVLKALEEQRSAGVIGSSLEAKIVFETSSENWLKDLQSHEQMLEEFFGVSQIQIQSADSISNPISSQYQKLQVSVAQADGQKCERSWKYTTDVGQDPDYPTLSLRCAKIMKALQ